MDAEIDWQRQLDSSFGSGRDLPSGHYVLAGRRAVRRRRAAAVVVAATIAICGGAAWAASPGATPRGDAPAATHGPDADQDRTTDERDRGQDRKRDVTPSMSVEEEFGNNPAVLELDGLKVSPLAGAVLERLPNPMGYTPAQGRSIAIRVMYEGGERYSFMSLTDGGTSLSTTTHYATGDFAGWVDGVARTQRTLDVLNGVTASTSSTDRSDPDSWLMLTPDGLVAATRGNVLLEARVDVDLGGDFARDADRTGAVRMLVGGRPENVAYRIVDGRLEVIAGPGSYATLGDFLAWARQQYASGEGMR